jgi:2-polyprenyl-6-hydroxyphenyl methylase/3-demethylubiquinone-9 3-methyltransferase
MSTAKENIDQGEVEKFDTYARRWWDESGEFKTLHDINPLRTQYIAKRTPLDGKRIADIGCGGGLLTEALARAGATVTGIDMAEGPLQVAKLHAFESGVADKVNYEKTTVESFADNHRGEFDVVTCLEMLEHVPDPESVIAACRRLLKPGGEIFLSTINRNPKSYLLMVLGAEYALGLVPRGTHTYDKFIKPAELAQHLRNNDFLLRDVTGMTYNPLTRKPGLSSDTDVNYLVHATAGD